MAEEITMVIVKTAIRDKIKSLAAIKGKTMQDLIEEIFISFIKKENGE